MPTDPDAELDILDTCESEACEITDYEDKMKEVLLEALDKNDFQPAELYNIAYRAVVRRTLDKFEGYAEDCYSDGRDINSRRKYYIRELQREYDRVFGIK